MWVLVQGVLGHGYGSKTGLGGYGRKWQQVSYELAAQYLYPALIAKNNFELNSSF